LFSTIQEDLLIHKKVFYLNHLLEKCVPFLPEDMREIYTTYRLQQKLEKKIISLSDICSATRLILWVLFSDETVCIFLSCLKALCLQNASCPIDFGSSRSCHNSESTFPP
jgi:hypothetical protein